MPFLHKILPSEGLICVATPYPKGGYKHTFCETVDEAQEQITLFDSQGKTVYVAQASFDPKKIAEAERHNAALPKTLTPEERKKQKKKRRSQTNALYLQNFFLDIDCGDKWPLKTQKEGVTALKQFLADTNLPFPAVVSSGNGLYAHWPLEELVPEQQWRTIAQILKSVVAAYSPKLGGDQSRTADSASVLRPVGATHRKDPQNLKKVQLLKDCEPVKFTEFAALLSKAAKKKKINIDATQAPKQSGINDAFMEGLEGPPSSAALAANKCAQLARFRDTQGDVDEPYWYAALGVLVFCADGQALMHDWSCGHAGYSQANTDKKAQQYLDSGYGPTTCHKLGEVNSEGCFGCPHNGKIKSPIVLGRPEPKPIIELAEDGTEVEVESDMPRGFRLAEDGLHFEEDGKWTRFYDQDLRVSRIAFDESLGYQVAIIRHSLPFDGVMEFPMRSSLVHDPKAMMTYLSDNHVHVIGVKAKKVMVAYMESYISRLQRKRSMTQLRNQMGWKTINGKTMFVLGRKIFHADGTVETANFAKNVDTAAHGFRSEGDLNLWIQATAVLDKPKMEQFAFPLLCGFGAPLMKFTGFEGAMVSLDGPTGIGKTLMLRMAHSIYGYHKDLMMLRDDTRNSLVKRIGLYGNLPLTVDEITNIDGMELSDLVYRVTQGRDKVRLTKNAEERKVTNAWNTIAIVSTNSSLVEKLAGAKQDASAECNRIFEYPMHMVEDFSGETTSELFWTIDKNFGYAGERYLAWLVQNTYKVQTDLIKVQEKIAVDAALRGEERFWGAVVSTAIYGGLVAKSLGLIQFDVNRVMQWACTLIRGMRQERLSTIGSAVGVLGQFLDEHTNNRILVKGDAIGGRPCTLIEAPHGGLVIRHEVDKDRLYISRSAFRAWLARKYGAYGKIRTELTNLGALTNANKIKVLGGGTSYAGASQPCLEIDLKCQALGAVGLQLVHVKTAYELKEGAEG